MPNISIYGYLVSVFSLETCFKLIDKKNGLCNSNKAQQICEIISAPLISVVVVWFWPEALLLQQPVTLHDIL